MSLQDLIQAGAEISVRKTDLSCQAKSEARTGPAKFQQQNLADLIVTDNILCTTDETDARLCDSIALAGRAHSDTTDPRSHEESYCSNQKDMGQHPEAVVIAP